MSGLRCAERNKKEDGNEDSSHLYGLAADIAVTNSTERFKLIEAAMLCGIKRIGVGKTFVHVDVDPAKDQHVMWMYP